MTDLLDELMKEEQRLTNLINSISKELKILPKGNLRISSTHGYTQLLVRESESEREKYINKSKHDLACKIAQREYDENVIPVLESKLKKVKILISSICNHDEEKVFSKMHPVRQSMVNPTIETDERFIESWEAAEYQGKDFNDCTIEIYTEKGERVRSKSEKIIADKLYKEGIPYRYEYPLRLRGYGIVYPDFLTLNKRTRKEYIWEHFGMMNDSQYSNKAIVKMNMYAINGMYPGGNTIFTFETSEMPFDTRILGNVISQFLL